MKKLFLTLAFAAVLVSLIFTQPVLAQGTTAFTYQGQLNDGGTNANGVYTMIFALYDAITSGNQIGSSITNSPTLANGLFTVNLDFGAGAFNGSARWLDITVTNGGTSQELSPRVQVLPSPYALYASSAGTAASLGTGSWSASVTNYQSKSNVFLIYDNGALVMGITSNQVAVPNELQVDSNLNVNGSITLGGGSISGDSQGDLILGGNVIGAIPQMQVFNSSGNFVVPSNVTTMMVEVWGGGGGGGSSVYQDSFGYTGGGGGGGGGYGKDIISVTPGSNMVVTVGSGGGTGGTSSFGSVSATGGGSGGNAVATLGDGAYGGYGGSPGTSTASISISGVQGGGGKSSGSIPQGAGAIGQGGAGANGGAGGLANGGSIGNGQAPGGGGAGNPTGSPSSGASGRVIIWY